MSKRYRLVGRDGAEYLSPAKGLVGGDRRGRFSEGWAAHPLCERSRRATLTGSTACFSPTRRPLWQPVIGLAGIACGQNTRRGALGGCRHPEVRADGAPPE